MRVALLTNTPPFAPDLCDEIRLFFDVKKIETGAEPGDADVFVSHEWGKERAFWIHRARVYVNGVLAAQAEEKTPAFAESDALLYKKMAKRGAKKSVFLALRKCKPESELPWGSLTGIRPTKLLRDTQKEMGAEAARKLFLEEFFVSEEKTALAEEIVKNQRPAIESISENTLDLYIGIPFCTSRCAYCSFSSGLTSRDGKLEEAYVSALIREIEACKGLLVRRPRCVYVGGGTPTALSARELSRLLSVLSPLAQGGEFTVEAGRPDTITREKLALLKEAGVNRVSVNAQTTNDETLARIGRAHTAADFFRACEMVAEYGFDAVNSDLILGLPGEDAKTVERSVREVAAQGFSNITVHSLAMKRASKFAMEYSFLLPDEDEMRRMQAASIAPLREAGLAPYYMYRQKYMAGHLENVGYALPGKECIYNIDMMEETATILAFGAGGMSKRVFRAGERIERAPNVKNIEHYLARWEEMAQRKRALMAL